MDPKEIAKKITEDPDVGDEGQGPPYELITTDDADEVIRLSRGTRWCTQDERGREIAQAYINRYGSFEFIVDNAGHAVMSRNPGRRWRNTMDAPVDDDEADELLS